MQKSRNAASKGAPKPVAVAIAALLVAAMSFMAIDANTLREAFADSGSDGPVAELNDGDMQPDDSAAAPETEAQEGDESQPTEESEGASEPEGEQADASSRDGPADEASGELADPTGSQDSGKSGDATDSQDLPDASGASDANAEDAAQPMALRDGAGDVATAAEQVSSVVTFYGNAASQNPSIVARKLVTAEAGQTAVVDVSDVTAQPPTAAEAFDGWLFRGEVERDEIVIDPADGDVDLYPAFVSGHWIRFSTAVGSGEATEVASQFVGAAEPSPEALVTSSRVGYSFDGWYTGSRDGDTVSYDVQVSDGEGAVVDRAFLKDLLAGGDVELFAKWTGQPTTYRVVFWHENPDDDGYSYEGFELVGDGADERAVSGETTDVSDIPEVPGFTVQPIGQRPIAGDGSTVVNVYYKRNVYEVLFHQGRTNDSAIFTDLTIEAKYGADVHDDWPKAAEGNGAYTAAWYTLPDENSNVFVTGIGTMPLGGAHYYVKNDVGLNCNTVFRVQAVDGSNSFSDYVSQPFTTELSPWTTADDYKPIKGFMVNAASDADAGAIRDIPAGDKGAVHEPGFPTSAPVGAKYEEAPEVIEEGDVARHTLYFYYLRCQYDIVFEENGGAPVPDETDVYYEASLADRVPEAYVPGETTYTAAGGMTYEFVGWYANPTLTGEQFDFADSKMPAGNIVLYAKWEPKRYLVQVDPAGGAFDDPAQSTFFLVAHGDPVGTIGASRDYVADDSGEYVYDYTAFAGDREGSGHALYSLAQPGDEGKRYRYDPGVYSLFGWFEQTDGVVSATPYDFNAAVTRDVSIIARWQSEGVFDVVYNPVMRVEGGSVSGDVDVRLDDGYADLSPTFVMNTPEGVESSDGREYRFVGWQLVDGFDEGSAPLVDGLFLEGDPFTVDSELARDNMIHFQAIYEVVPDETPGETPGETPVLVPEANPGGSDLDPETGADDDGATDGDEGQSTVQRVLASTGLLPKTDDTAMMLAVGVAGIALIAFGVALMARAMRRRHDDLISEDE